MSEAVMNENQSDWLDRPLLSTLNLDWEKVAYIVIIALAVLTRFGALDVRVMSFDESEHVYYAWDLFRGNGYQHTPLTHGPFLFHANALAYALFGVNDFTARMVPAIFGLLLVASPILLRPWLGRRGALAVSVLLLISPTILFHSRYIRNDIYMLLFGVLMIWGILSYFRDRAPKWLYLLSALAALMYITKEVSFIYIATYGLVVVAAGIVEIAGERGWGRAGVAGTLLGLVAALVALVVGIVAGARILDFVSPVVAEGESIGLAQTWPSVIVIVMVAVTISVAVYYLLKLIVPEEARRSRGVAIAIILAGLSLFMLSVAMLIPLNHVVGEETEIVSEPTGDDSPDVMTEIVVPDTGMTIWGILNGTNSLEPYVPESFFAAGSFPIDQANTTNALRSLFLFASFSGLAMGLGLWWDWRKWLVALAIFGAINIVFFTTIFTNGVGLFTGLIGSLGYWLEQQEVQRGSQPTGYYFLVVSIYEYLPILLTLIALTYYRFGRLFVLPISIVLLSVAFLPATWALLFTALVLGIWIIFFRNDIVESIRRVIAADVSDISSSITMPLLFVWMVLAWLAYTLAGEKMPWLMVHMALPMVFVGGRLVGDLSDRVDWRGVAARREWLAAILVPIFFVALFAIIGSFSLFSRTASEAVAPSLVQLNALSSLLSGALVAGGALIALRLLARRIGGYRPIWHMTLAAGFGALLLLTLRTSWNYNYVNYDSALEFGVYAHGGPGIKIALNQMQELSQRLTGTPNEIEVLYDEEASWPWRWYLRDFKNQRFINSEPSRSDASLPVMLLSSDNWDVVDRAVGDSYTSNQFHLIWWPMEDYKRAGSILECPTPAYDENSDGQIDANEQALGDQRCSQHSSSLAAALWEIFFYRDYTQYAELTGQTLTARNWQHQKDFRLYVRRDLAAQVWDQAIGTFEGGGVFDFETSGDVYSSGWRDVDALMTFGELGSGEGELNSPHGIALADDGSIYVADSLNHRVVKYDADGNFLLSFGTWSGEPPGGDRFNPEWRPPSGTFYEPWDVAIAPDGSVIVADLWNSRIQRFDADGNFINMWGHFGDSGSQAVGAPGEFFGPRGVAVDAIGRVFVSDTGNKRIQIFDTDGNFILQFGGGGLLEGNLDEPVGIAVAPTGEIVIADTWNGRIQVFTADGGALTRWDIDDWFDPLEPDQGRNRVGKPYLTVGPDGVIYVSDQAGSRILAFNLDGEYQGSFGLPGTNLRSFNAPSGLAVDKDGNIYLVDTGNSRVMIFPPLSESDAQVESEVDVEVEE